MDPKVVVGTLTWNQKKDVLECLRSLIKLDYPNYEIVMVDNGSTDGTVEAVREEFPQVVIVPNEANLGCAEGVNGEIRYAIQAKADYLFIVANDALVEPSTLTELVKVAKRNPELGMIFPKVYYYQSNRIWFARGIKLHGGVDWLRGRFSGFVQDVEDDGSYDEESEADVYPGRFCMVSMPAVKKVGFLDPRYFIYFDDSEWLARMARQGFHGRYAPRARTWHKASSSVGMESPAFYYYRTRNRLYFYRQFSPVGYFPFFMIYFFFELVTKTAPRLILSKMLSQLSAVGLGILDFLHKKMGSRMFEVISSGRPKGVKVLCAEEKGEERPQFFIKKLTGANLCIRVCVGWNLGDEIMTLPVFEVLRKKYPQARIEGWMRFPALLKGNAFVSAVNEEDTPADKVLNLRREVRGKSRIEYLKALVKTDELPFPKVYLSSSEIAEVRQKWALESRRPLVAVSSSARWFTRRWESERWTKLVHSLMELYGARVLVLGTAGENLSVGEDLTGRTSVREAALILSQCDLFIGADSGLVHLALAVGTPTVGLYGPLNPDYLVSPRPGFTAIWSEVECRGCWSDGRMIFPDHCPKIVPDCMSSITVSKVLEASGRFIEGRGIRIQSGFFGAKEI